jgi:hypothetical protein
MIEPTKQERLQKTLNHFIKGQIVRCAEASSRLFSTESRLNPTTKNVVFINDMAGNELDVYSTPLIQARNSKIFWSETSDLGAWAN